MSNVRSAESLYSSINDLLPYDVVAQSSQYQEIEADRNVASAPASSILQFKCPQNSDAVWALDRSFMRGAIQFNNTQRGENYSEFLPIINGIGSQDIVAIQQSMMAGLGQWDLEIGSVSANSYVTNQNFQALAQGWWYLLNNGSKKPKGSARLCCSSDIVTNPEAQPTLEGGVTAGYSLSLVPDDAPETPFAELCLNNTTPVNVSANSNLGLLSAQSLDSGFLYRVRLLKSSEIIAGPMQTVDRPPTPESVWGIVETVFQPIVTFVARPPIPLLSNPFSIPANLLVNLRFKLAPNAYNIIRGYSTANSTGVFPNYSAQLLDLKWMVPLVRLQPDASRLVALEKVKAYSFHGVNMSAYALSNASQFQQLINTAPKTPSALLFAIVPVALFSGNVPSSSGNNYALSDFLCNGGPWTDNSTGTQAAISFTINQAYVQLNGLRYPESNYMLEIGAQTPVYNVAKTSGGVVTAATSTFTNVVQRLGDSDLYLMTRACMRNPDRFTENMFKQLGVFGVNLITSHDAKGNMFDTAQKISDSKPTLNVSYTYNSTVGTPFVSAEWQMMVCCLYDRLLTITDNATVDFSAS